jgi:hypothetical protein
MASLLGASYSDVTVQRRSQHNPSVQLEEDMDITISVRLFALLLAALMTGALMVNWIGLARAIAQMVSAAAYTEFHQATNRDVRSLHAEHWVWRNCGRYRSGGVFFRRAFCIRLVGDRWNHLLCGCNRNQLFDQCADQSGDRSLVDPVTA